MTAVGLGNVLLQIPLGMMSDLMRDRRHMLVACAAIGLAGMLVLPVLSPYWRLTAAMLFVWGGVVAGLYTVGLAHLGAKLTGRDLASANAAFVLCYGIGMFAGPQLIGIGMDGWVRTASPGCWPPSSHSTSQSPSPGWPLRRRRRQSDNDRRRRPTTWRRSPARTGLDFPAAASISRSEFSAPGPGARRSSCPR